MSLLLVAAILGIVEGLTEFIPVSSTGHLILAGHLLGFTGAKAAAFEIFIQLGAILAVVRVERARLAALFYGLFGGRTAAGAGGAAASAGAPPDARPSGAPGATDPRREAFGLLANLALGFIPAAIAGLLLHTWIEANLFSPRTVAWGLLLGGIGILLVEATAKPPSVDGSVVFSWRIAAAIGLCQCLSLFPGVSRSAATILGGVALGLSRRAATEFSFLLAIPTLTAASLYNLWKVRDILAWPDAVPFAAGFVTSFAAAIVTVKFLLKWVGTHDFKPFAWYRIAAGAMTLLVLAWWS